MSNLKLVMHRHARGELFVDGIKVAPVRVVKLEVGVDQANVATITLIPDQIEVEGEFDVSTIYSTARELRMVPAADVK